MTTEELTELLRPDPKQYELYLGEEGVKHFEKVMAEILKDYVPYIEQVGPDEYKVSGNKDHFYITNKTGAEEAIALLKEKSKEYGNTNKEN